MKLVPLLVSGACGVVLTLAFSSSSAPQTADKQAPKDANKNTDLWRQHYEAQAIFNRFKEQFVYAAPNLSPSICKDLQELHDGKLKGIFNILVLSLDNLRRSGQISNLEASYSQESVSKELALTIDAIKDNITACNNESNPKESTPEPIESKDMKPFVHYQPYKFKSKENII